MSLLILNNNQSGIPSYTIVPAKYSVEAYGLAQQVNGATYSAEYYAIEQQVNAIYANEIYSLATTITSNYYYTYYSLVNDWVGNAYSNLAYNIMQDLNNVSSVFSYENWNILSTIVKSSSVVYTLLQDVNNVWSTEKYSIYTSSISAYIKEVYSLALPVISYSQEQYQILSFIVSPQSSTIGYDISYSSGTSGNFEVLGNFETYFEIDYATLLYNDIQVFFTSSYEFAGSGLLGITEREIGCWGAWENLYNEVNTFLQLYNTVTSEHSSAYARYYTISSNKNIFVSFTLLYNERHIATKFYSTPISEKTIFTSGCISYFTQQYCAFKAYANVVSERVTTCGQILTGYSERSNYFRCAYTDARYICFKAQQFSEVQVVYFAIESIIYADQRNTWCQVTEDEYVSIKLAYYEVCSLSYDFEISPSYTDFEYTINEETNTLFENENVVGETTTFTNIPINTSTVSNDIIIINPDIPTETPIYGGNVSVTKINFTQFENTNTYTYNGEIVTTSDTLFIKVDLFVSTLDIYDTAEEYINFIRSVGYLTINIGGLEITPGSPIVIDVPAFTKVPIVINAYKGILDTQDVKVQLKWAYPYQYSTINKILLIGFY